jgi:hypothetical protein
MVQRRKPATTDKSTFGKLGRNMSPVSESGSRVQTDVYYDFRTWGGNAGQFGLGTGKIADVNVTATTGISGATWTNTTLTGSTTASAMLGFLSASVGITNVGQSTTFTVVLDDVGGDLSPKFSPMFFGESAYLGTRFTYDLSWPYSVQVSMATGETTSVRFTGMGFSRGRVVSNRVDSGYPRVYEFMPYYMDSPTIELAVRNFSTTAPSGWIWNWFSLAYPSPSGEQTTFDTYA